MPMTAPMAESAPESRALAGVVVVSLAINLPGPVAAARYVALGAMVTTVLPPSGDPLARYEPQWFADLHAGQELLTIDLSRAEGREQLHRLLAAADLLITSSRPSALARMGLDQQSLATRHPRLCQLAIVGHPGAQAEVPGHDLTYQASNGLITPPAMPATLIADLAGAERAAAQGLAALLHRERTGTPLYCEVALSEVAAAMAVPARLGLTSPGGPLGGGLGVYGIYQAQEGWVALAALEPHFAKSVLTELGVDGSPAAFAAKFATRTAAEWEQWAAEHDIPLAAVRGR